MSMVQEDGLLAERGGEKRIDDQITGCAISRDGHTAAFATGAGDVVLVPRTAMQQPGMWTTVEAHDGAILSIAPDVLGDSFLTGGDDNTLRRIDAAGAVKVLVKGRRWVENIRTWINPKREMKSALIAFSTGKQVELRDGTGETQLKVLEHPSTATGLVFDTKGKRIAASHYNGASIWYVGAKVDSPREMAWKGSHIGIAIHPEGEALVTSMQENDLHGWRLSDGHNMRMSGYPSKVLAMSFTRTGKWLATSGADSIVLWPFTGGGPMGKAPTELARLDGVFCTQVQCHPQHDIVAAGYANGMVVLAEVGSSRVLAVCGPGRGSVSSLVFSPDGSWLAFGTENGAMGVVDLSAH